MLVRRGRIRRHKDIGELLTGVDQHMVQLQKLVVIETTVAAVLGARGAGIVGSAMGLE